MTARPDAHSGRQMGVRSRFSRAASLNPHPAPGGRDRGAHE